MENTTEEPIIAAQIGNVMVLEDVNEPHNLLVYRDIGQDNSTPIAVFFPTEEGIILATLFAARVYELCPEGPITVDSIGQDMMGKIIVPDLMH